MKYIKILLVAAVLIAAFFIYRSFQTPNYVNFPPTATGDWIAFGDSLTSGYGAGDGKDYPTVLSAKLGVPIQNFGIAGNTTQDGLDRLDQAVRLKPRVVLLCLGGNDALQHLPPEQTFANLATIIDRFHEAGSFVVLIGVRSASFRDTNAGHFKTLAKEKKVLYISNILDGVIGRPSLMSDYIHPNDAGYAAIADRLEGELLKILSRL